MPSDEKKKATKKRRKEEEPDDDEESEEEEYQDQKEEDDGDDNDDDDDEEEEETGKPKRNSDGDAFFALGNGKRRATVRKFKNIVLIDIREYYEKDGDFKPGKKGISLSEEQYHSLAKLIKSGAIDKEVKALNKK